MEADVGKGLYRLPTTKKIQDTLQKLHYDENIMRRIYELKQAKAAHCQGEKTIKI